MHKLTDDKLVSLIFECSDNNVSVSIETPYVDGVEQELVNDHIATRWARLGMRYFSQMKEKKMFHDLAPHVEPVRTRIVFSNSDHLLQACSGDFEEELNVDLEQFDIDDYEIANEFFNQTDEEKEMSIGMNFYVETMDRIGGFSTPSAIAGLAVYRLLFDNMNQVKA
ncbi:hypothetical protein [Psychromonas sp. SP041]|uniref:hypothetical protein n=1 Tax=Psychromonas sp. SP041 TaxID=1365007 RepID=UPI0010C7B1AD|nr:hypothetical protein [Psychromonas sp. SP041]